MASQGTRGSTDYTFKLIEAFESGSSNILRDAIRGLTNVKMHPSLRHRILWLILTTKRQKEVFRCLRDTENLQKWPAKWKSEQVISMLRTLVSPAYIQDERFLFVVFELLGSPSSSSKPTDLQLFQQTLLLEIQREIVLIGDEKFTPVLNRFMAVKWEGFTLENRVLFFVKFLRLLFSVEHLLKEEKHKEERIKAEKAKATQPDSAAMDVEETQKTLSSYELLTIQRKTLVHLAEATWSEEILVELPTLEATYLAEPIRQKMEATDTAEVKNYESGLMGMAKETVANEMHKKVAQVTGKDLPMPDETPVIFQNPLDKLVETLQSKWKKATVKEDETAVSDVAMLQSKKDVAMGPSEEKNAGKSTGKQLAARHTFDSPDLILSLIQHQVTKDEASAIELCLNSQDDWYIHHYFLGSDPMLVDHEVFKEVSSSQHISQQEPSCSPNRIDNAAAASDSIYASSSSFHCQDLIRYVLARKRACRPYGVSNGPELEGYDAYVRSLVRVLRNSLTDQSWLQLSVVEAELISRQLRRYPRRVHQMFYDARPKNADRMLDIAWVSKYYPTHLAHYVHMVYFGNVKQFLSIMQPQLRREPTITEGEIENDSILSHTCGCTSTTGERMPIIIAQGIKYPTNAYDVSGVGLVRQLCKSFVRESKYLNFVAMLLQNSDLFGMHLLHYCVTEDRILEDDIQTSFGFGGASSSSGGGSGFGGGFKLFKSIEERVRISRIETHSRGSAPVNSTGGSYKRFIKQMQSMSPYPDLVTKDPEALSHFIAVKNGKEQDLLRSKQSRQIRIWKEQLRRGLSPGLSGPGLSDTKGLLNVTGANVTSANAVAADGGGSLVAAASPTHLATAGDNNVNACDFYKKVLDMIAEKFSVEEEETAAGKASSSAAGGSGSSSAAGGSGGSSKAGVSITTKKSPDTDDTEKKKKNEKSKSFLESSLRESENHSDVEVEVTWDTTKSKILAQENCFEGCPKREKALSRPLGIFDRHIRSVYLRYDHGEREETFTVCRGQCVIDLVSTCDLIFKRLGTLATGNFTLLLRLIAYVPAKHGPSGFDVEWWGGMKDMEDLIKCLIEAVEQSKFPQDTLWRWLARDGLPHLDTWLEPISDYLTNHSYSEQIECLVNQLKCFQPTPLMLTVVGERPDTFRHRYVDLFRSWLNYAPEMTLTAIKNIDIQTAQKLIEWTTSTRESQVAGDVDHLIRVAFA